jgi:hypothetical protein
MPQTTCHDRQTDRQTNGDPAEHKKNHYLWGTSDCDWYLMSGDEDDNDDDDGDDDEEEE